MSEAAPPQPPGEAVSAPGNGIPAGETPGGVPTGGTEGAPGTGPRPARKRFILIGFAIGVAIVVLIGLFTSSGSGTGSSGSGSVQAGDPVPTFTRANVGPVGPRLVHVTATPQGAGTPMVLLFFGAWCTACHHELPPLAAAVRNQQQAGGALSHVRVVGVDTLDSYGDAKSFIKNAGVAFPVAYDYDAAVTQNDFGFRGDPFTVFVKADGTISRIVRGDQLTPATFTADERALIPSGR